MPAKHEQIAGSLIKDILSGRYMAQDRLPSERDLSTKFDANRGAVREAMKKLEHLGFAEILPGGARVKDRTEASLDAIGHMLDEGVEGGLPNIRLIDQILVVINSLVSVAAEQTLELADEVNLANIRKLIEPLTVEDGDEESYYLARFELMRAFMDSSNNLPLQMIARSLAEQFVPHLSAISQYSDPDISAFATFARQLDRAIANKDQEALRASFVGLSNLNRESMLRGFETAKRELGQEAIKT